MILTLSKLEELLTLLIIVLPKLFTPATYFLMLEQLKYAIVSNNCSLKLLPHMDSSHRKIRFSFGLVLMKLMSQLLKEDWKMGNSLIKVVASFQEIHGALLLTLRLWKAWMDLAILIFAASVWSSWIVQLAFIYYLPFGFSNRALPLSPAWGQALSHRCTIFFLFLSLFWLYSFHSKCSTFSPSLSVCLTVSRSVPLYRTLFLIYCLSLSRWITFLFCLPLTQTLTQIPTHPLFLYLTYTHSLFFFLFLFFFLCLSHLQPHTTLSLTLSYKRPAF